MKKILTLSLLIMIFAVAQSSGQTFEELEFGTDSTFEVVTWNIEWFPKDGPTTVGYVTEIIEALDVDLIAMQELDDTDMFDQMMDSLENYVGYYESGWFAGLAYIYNPDVIEINDIYEIYTTEEYWSAFPRSPMVMDLNYNDENIFVINNHYKCCGDGVLDYGNNGDEEYRRDVANELLKQYIDVNLPDSKVIVLGDLNDILTDAEANNVFQMILDDTENYLFADLEIEQGSSSNWSYPTWPSHIDHILITNELFDEYSNNGSEVETIRLDDYFDNWWAYDNNVSDHRPVGVKIKTNASLGIDDIAVADSFLNYPNPIKNTTTIYFNPVLTSAEVEIFNMSQQKIQHFDLDVNQSKVVWNTDGVEAGIYFSRLIVEGKIKAVRKMVVIN